MFYEVRITDANGNLKRKISQKDLTKAFWKKIYTEEEKSNAGVRNTSNPSIRKKLKEMYPHLYDSSLSFNY